jgi:hypothetical protein
VGLRESVGEAGHDRKFFIRVERAGKSLGLNIPINTPAKIFKEERSAEEAPIEAERYPVVIPTIVPTNKINDHRFTALIKPSPLQGRGLGEGQLQEQSPR